MGQYTTPTTLGINDVDKEGDRRTSKIKKNLFFSYLIKALSIGLGVLLVPLSVEYLDKRDYGVWLTLSSIISWISFLDVGLGNGLRNKFAEARAVDDDELAKIYVSTAFAVLSIFAAIALAIFSIANHFLDWHRILNYETQGQNELSILALIVFFSFCIQIVLKLTTSILLADQKPALSDFVMASGSILSLTFLILLIHAGRSSLLYFGIAFSVSPVLTLGTAYLVMFSRGYKSFRPSFKYVDFQYSRKLLSLGLQFFIPQIASIVVFYTSNLLIAQYIGPAEVTTYGVAYKYFSVFTMLFQILLNPFWSAFTEAYVKNEIDWIVRTVNKLVLAWGGLCLITLVMFYFSDPIIHVWMRGKVHVPLFLSGWLAIFVCISTWNSIFVAFNCGVSKIRLQLYQSLFSGLIFVPLAALLVKSIGITGIVVSMVLSIFLGTILAPIQYLKLVSKTARGIWAK